MDVRPFFLFIAGADTGAQQNVSYCTDERDWAELLPVLVSHVADLALRSDVTDYIRLRAVCKPWRRSAEADPAVMGMVPRFFPRNWEMVQGNSRGDEIRRFVNVVTGASIHLKIPRQYGEVAATAEGCLLFALAGCCRNKMRLFNPVTRAVADLPGVFFSSHENLPVDCHAAGFVYETDTDADPTLVLCVMAWFGFERRVLYSKTKPGDTVWQVADSELVPYSDGAISVRGRLYVPTPAGEVHKLELRPRPHLVHVARQEARHMCDCDELCVSSYLLPKADRMLLVRITMFMPKPFEEVFWVNIPRGTLTLVQQDDVHHFITWLTLRSG